MDDNIIIQEGGMRFVMSRSCSLGCNGCELKRSSHDICRMCVQGATTALKCISATKIQPEPKTFHAANKNDAKQLIGDRVEWFDGVNFLPGRLTKVVDSLGFVPFEIDNALTATVIRKLPTTKLTLAQLIEMAGIEGDVEIVEEVE